jgi:hypothetical protein
VGTVGQSIALKQAIERALRRGVVVVCSAGNSGQDLDTNPYYPASFGLKDLIIVAATDNQDQLASWSNWGSRKATVAAPGTNILTTQRDGGYWSVSGTSAAAPLVTGIVGLLKTSRPLAKLNSPANQPSFVPRGSGSGGNGPGGGFSTTPPPTTTGAPDANLPNLDQIRTAPPQKPKGLWSHSWSGRCVLR